MNDKPYRHVVLFRFQQNSKEETVRGIEMAFSELASRGPELLQSLGLEGQSSRSPA